MDVYKLIVILICILIIGCFIWWILSRKSAHKKTGGFDVKGYFGDQKSKNGVMLYDTELLIPVNGATYTSKPNPEAYKREIDALETKLAELRRKLNDENGYIINAAKVVPQNRIEHKIYIRVQEYLKSLLNTKNNIILKGDGEKYYIGYYNRISPDDLLKAILHHIIGIYSNTGISVIDRFPTGNRKRAWNLDYPHKMLGGISFSDFTQHTKEIVNQNSESMSGIDTAFFASGVYTPDAVIKIDINKTSHYLIVENDEYDDVGTKRAYAKFHVPDMTTLNNLYESIHTINQNILQLRAENIGLLGEKNKLLNKDALKLIALNDTLANLEEDMNLKWNKQKQKEYDDLVTSIKNLEEKIKSEGETMHPEEIKATIEKIKQLDDQILENTNKIRDYNDQITTLHHSSNGSSDAYTKFITHVVLYDLLLNRKTKQLSETLKSLFVEQKYGDIVKEWAQSFNADTWEISTGEWGEEPIKKEDVTNEEKEKDAMMLFNSVRQYLSENTNNIDNVIDFLFKSNSDSYTPARNKFLSKNRSNWVQYKKMMFDLCDRVIKKYGEKVNVHLLRFSFPLGLFNPSTADANALLNIRNAIMFYFDSIVTMFSRMSNASSSLVMLSDIKNIVPPEKIEDWFTVRLVNIGKDIHTFKEFWDILQKDSNDPYCKLEFGEYKPFSFTDENFNKLIDGEIFKGTRR